MDGLSVSNDVLPADLQVDLPFELVLTILELLALQFPRKHFNLSIYLELFSAGKLLFVP
jgi:hypothetical protein